MKKSQLRQHLKWTFRHRIRQKMNVWRGVTLGEGVFIEKGVELMRYPKNIVIDNQVVLKEGAKICSCNKDALIKIGMNTTIGYHCFVFASNGISIGDNCLIAPFVYIVDSDHNIEKSQLINQQGNQTSPIKIGSDVWIGTGAKILKGVTIGEGAVIAAGAIIRTDVEPYSIYAGIPGKKISERK